MRLALAAALLVLRLPAWGAEAGAVRRGDLIVRVKATGTVAAEDVFRLKSAIEGRVEEVTASSMTWRRGGEKLAALSNKELAAMIDAKGSLDQDVVEDRWKQVYRPTPVRCPDDCYVLKVYARPRAWVKPQAVLFEAAKRLKMIGRVGALDARLLRDGMAIAFWPASDPSRRLTGRISGLVMDAGDRDEAGATFTVEVPRDLIFPPNTAWEGELVPVRRDDVLMVPTAALIRQGGAVYLPVRVSTGITTEQFTQIVGGAEERREILVLDEAQLRGARRHARDAEPPAVELRGRAAPAAEAPPAEKEKKTPPARPPKARDDGYGGEDPYGDQ